MQLPIGPVILQKKRGVLYISEQGFFWGSWRSLCWALGRSFFGTLDGFPKRRGDSCVHRSLCFLHGVPVDNCQLYFSVSDFGFVSTFVGYVVKCDQLWKIARISYIFSFNSDNLFTCQFALPTFEKFHFIVNNLMSSNFSLSFEWIFTSVTRNWSIFCGHPLVTLEEVWVSDTFWTVFAKKGLFLRLNLNLLCISFRSGALKSLSTWH